MPTQHADYTEHLAATRKAHLTLVEEALAIIGSEYATGLRLPVVARRIGASDRALQRALAEHTELSFSDHLRATRLNAAARLLRGTDLPVGAVAHRVGYSSHGPFTKAHSASTTGSHRGRTPRAAGRSTGRTSSPEPMPQAATHL